MKNKLNMPIILILLLCMLFTFSACKNKGDDIEYGTITEIGEIKLAEGNEKDGENYFTPLKNSTGKSFKTYKDGFGKMSIPYPDDWTKSVTASNQIYFKDPSGKACIIVEHTYLTADAHWGVEPDIETVVSNFNWQLDNQKFSIGNEINIHRGQDQNKTEFNGLKEINTSDLILKGEEYRNLHTEKGNGADYSRTTASEKRYYIYKDEMATCISLITSQDLFDKYSGIIDYSVSNIRGYVESYKSVFPISFCDRPIIIPSLFEEHSTFTVQNSDEVGMVYKVKDDCGSCLSGCFVAVVDGKKGSFNKKSIDADNMFFNAHSGLSGICKNMNSVSKVSSDDEPAMATCKIKQEYETKGYDVSSIYSIDYNIYRTALGGPYLIGHGDVWFMEYLIVTKDNKSSILLLGYPINAMDEIAVVAGNSISAK